MKLKVYGYENCSTCKKAIKWLKEQGVDYEWVSVADKSPSQKELKAMLTAQGGEIKKLFNTSGKSYREGNFAQKLPQMTNAEALKLLASDGMLVKRPFALRGDLGLVGFREVEWQALC